MNNENDKKKIRQKLLREQHIAVEKLIAECGSVEAAAAHLGVSADSIHNWRKETVATGLTRAKLLESVKKEVPKAPPKRGGRQPRYDVAPDKRHSLEKYLADMRLAPPELRAATLRALLEKSKLTIAAMAREIAVHENTLKDYLNPNYNRMMSLETAAKIAEFEKKITSEGSPRAKLIERLRQALLILLGAELVEGGFQERDWRRADAAKKIGTAAGISDRTVRRYFPPFQLDNSRVPATVVEAFEKAAKELGNVVSKK